MITMLVLFISVLYIVSAVTADTYTNANTNIILCAEPRMTITATLTLLYNYKVETTVAVRQIIPVTLKKLEATILQRLASEFLPCTEYSNSTSSTKRTTSTRRLPSVAPDLGIMGFDSSPIDSISTTTVCEPIINPKNNCTVVNGAINILLTSLSPPDEVVRYTVLSSIQESMYDGIYTDTINGLFLVEYTGPTILSPPNTLATTTNRPSTQSSITSTQIIILIFIVTVAVIAIGIFILAVLFPKKKITASCTRTDIEYTGTQTDGDLTMDETGSESMKAVLKKKEIMQYHSHPVHMNDPADDATVAVAHVPSSSMSVCSEHSAKTRKTGWNSRDKTEKRLNMI